jgi:hypothetical protein
MLRIMTPLHLLPALLLAPAVPPRPSARAPLQPLPARIYLTLKRGATEARASAIPAVSDVAVRQVLEIKPGETPELRWSVVSVDRKKPIASVAVHILVVRQGQRGERIPPGLRKGTLMDTVLGTDVAPGQSVSGQCKAPVFEIGSYLVELELLDEQGNRRQFCAVDLEVRP